MTNATERLASSAISAAALSAATALDRIVRGVPETDTLPVLRFLDLARRTDAQEYGLAEAPTAVAGILVADSELPFPKTVTELGAAKDHVLDGWEKAVRDKDHARLPAILGACLDLHERLVPPGP